MKKTLIRITVTDNPLEKGYKMYEFHHPLHGRKCLGCFKGDSKKKHFNLAAQSFTLNCGYPTSKPSDVFSFIHEEDNDA